MNNIPEFEIDSVSELQDLVSKFGMSADFVYRGQKRSHESITSSLERHVDDELSRKYLLEEYSEVGYDNLYALEHRIIREFNVGLHHYVDVPPNHDYLQLLALMQHYGAPTRLIDVTRSMFVALFFAVSHDDDIDGVVYTFFNLDWFYQDQPYEPKYLKPNRFLKSAFADIPMPLPGEKDLPQGAVRASPKQLNKRQIAQQGEFLMPVRIDRSFEDNLHFTHSLDPNCGNFEYGDNRIPGNENPVIRWIIPRRHFAKIRLSLTHMNVTGLSLFPDIDGFARSMNEVAKQWRGANY